MEAILFIGIQASGKSSFYKENFSDSHIRINLDMLKTRQREKILIKACIEAKQQFVIDNTNPGVKDRQYYFDLLKHSDFTIKGYYFSSKIKDSLLRNKNRSNCIPETGILSCYNRLELPQFSEGFEELYYVELYKSGFSVTIFED